MSSSVYDLSIIAAAKTDNMYAIMRQIPSEAQWLLSYSEKFADLIIRECLDVCLAQDGNADYNTGRLHCHGNIKEHFGSK
jgi:hypothetical protein